MRSRWFYYFTSFVLHFFIFGFALLLLTREPLQLDTLPLSPWIEIISTEGTPTQRTSPHTKTAKSVKTPNLAQLGIAPRTLNLGNEHTTAQADAFESANQTGLKEEGELHPFFTALRNRINGSLTYPDDFSKQRIKGLVQVQFEVNEKGQLIGNFGPVSADDPFLKTYVLALLLHTLKEPLAKNNWSHNGNQLVVVHFNFQLYTKNEVPIEELFPQFKNSLTLTRLAYVEPLINEKISYAYEHYFPPIIPIPGGFYVDFVRAYQIFNNIGKPDPDQMRNHRLSDQRERWSSFIQKNTP
jgi:hypothetical protein